MNYILKQSAIEYLNRLLHLPATGKEQDWDIELADATRLDDFLNVLDHQHLSDDQKQALMALIIASYDDFLGLGQSAFDPYRERIALHLQKNPLLYEDLLNYWALWGDDNSENLWNVTPFIRANPYHTQAH